MIEGEGPQNSSYAIVEVEPGGNIDITGFRKAESIMLKKIK